MQQNPKQEWRDEESVHNWLVKANRQHTHKGCEIVTTAIWSRIEPEPDGIQCQMSRHGIRGHPHNEELARARQQHRGNKCILPLCWPNVARGAKEGNDAHRIEQWIKEGLQRDALKNGAHCSVNRQVSRLP